MKRKDCEVLLPLVNSRDDMDALRHYMKVREEVLKEGLAKAATIDDVRRLQGAIEEIRRIERLREEVLTPTE